MNRQRIRDITFAQICEVCGYGAVGRQFGKQTYYEGGLLDQAENCHVLAANPMEECIHWRRAKVVIKPEE